jgi:two-component system sensor kinase FixL
VAHVRPDATRRLAAIVDALDDAVIDTDLDGVIVGWNRGAERLYGYSAEEAKGCSMAMLRPDDDQGGEFLRTLERVRAGQRVDRVDTVRCTKDGRRVEVSFTLSPIWDATGQVVAAVALARGLSALTQAERAGQTSEARWRALIESAVDGIVVINARGRIEVFNPAAEQLFGYTAGEMVGQSVNRLMPAPDCDEHDGYIMRYLTTGVRKILGIGRQVNGRRRDGTTFPLLLSVGEVSVEGKRTFVGVLHDLSERVQLEERLRDQTTMARIGEMAAVLAHEVRNPLAGVRGAVEVISHRLPPGNGDATTVTQILARIDTLDSLMKDLLLFARPPRLRPRVVDVGLVIAATAALAKDDPIFHDVRVEVSGSTPPIVADAELLKIVLLNLFLNSAQAMSGQGVIHVSVGLTEASCRIAIADQGPGISPATREKLFTPFFTTKARGTGLGLSVAKQIVEAHQGHIRVECPGERGTTVVVTLPLAHEGETRAHA